MIKPLENYRVLDFSQVLAGPACTQALGDLGADVIKVENPLSGDDTRGWPPMERGSGTVFLSANRNKRSIALDLKSPGAQKVIAKLVKGVDIVVESFSLGVTERLGIDYETLRSYRPDLIYCSIRGFGSTGPMASGKGYDMILQAFTGMQSIMGEPDGGPVRAPFSPIDQGTGMHAYSSILAALLQREKTGEGTHIEVSLFDTGMGFLGYMFQAYWERGTEPQRYGCAHESICPYQAFETLDKTLLLGVANDVQWVRFCEIAGLQEVLEDSRFETNAGRVTHRDEVIRIVSDILRTRTCQQWLDLFIAAGIPCSQINNFADVLSHPHTLESGMITSYRSEAYGELNSVTLPVRFNGQRAVPGMGPPTLGEHTIPILREMGFDEGQISELVENKVVAAPA